MTFDHWCHITRGPDVDGRDPDDFGQPIGEIEALSVYGGRCQVFDDEVALKRVTTGDESLIGWSSVRLQTRPPVAPKKGDRVEAVFNGVTRRGQVEAISALTHYPRLRVRWV